MAQRLAKLGYKFIATEGTCKLLRDGGVDAKVVRRLKEENPNILDVIKNKEVDLVINTPTKVNDSKSDGFIMRRAAVERNIGVITALDTFRAIVDVKCEGLENNKDLEVFNISEI